MTGIFRQCKTVCEFRKADIADEFPDDPEAGRFQVLGFIDQDAYRHIVDPASEVPEGAVLFVRIITIDDIVTFIKGFKQQMDNLFQNESMDISSDISVLETMMQKDGLSGNKDFAAPADYDFGGMAAQQMPADKDTETE